ncbi:hypothetical protein J2W96_005232 [Variovorax guangxiensis]|nr:hypothetical protein [Variovorax guangxiensis]
MRGEPGAAIGWQRLKIILVAAVPKSPRVTFGRYEATYSHAGLITSLLADAFFVQLL